MALMKIFAAAGLAIAAMGLGTAAEARPHDRGYSHAGYQDGGRYEDRGRHHDRGRHGWNRRDRGRHYGNGYRCRTEWRHHRRVRVCR